MKLFTIRTKSNLPAILFSYKIKLFGLITVFRKDVYERHIKYYFFGISVAKFRRKIVNEVVTFKDGTWYTIIYNGSIVQSLSHVPRNTIPPQPVGSEIRINVSRALEQMPDIDKIALVFFMGIGDYFYATPFIKKLKEKYKHLPFIAYVSNQIDGNNSPLVADCLRFDPNIDEVYVYNGTPNKKNWKNYDYSEVVSREPQTTLILPVIYEHTPLTLSRDDGLCDTFCLTRSALVPKPIIYTIPASDHVRETLERILKIVKCRNLRGVVWFQLKSRSANFNYRNAEKLATMLIDAGYFVVGVDPLDRNDECCLSLNLDQFRITDSIRLLQLINEHTKVYCLVMISCFMAISSALDIPNLAIAFWYDTNQKTVYYPNVYIITHVPYYCVPRQRQFLAVKETLENNQYKPDYIFECFTEMVESIGESYVKENGSEYSVQDI